MSLHGSPHRSSGLSPEDIAGNTSAHGADTVLAAERELERIGFSSDPTGRVRATRKVTGSATLVDGGSND
ncbi:hypothetical protein [Streptomyces sp. NPDC014685]|uniref:hypothetical protein n=1 Tax=Streptomyces sp. NPDC014685 TaxID=3364881 RepID=UPI0036F7A872